MLFPNNTNKKKKSFSIINQNQSNKSLKGSQYQLKLCILLNNNDSNYKEKRNDLNNFVIKYDDDYRMRLTRLQLISSNTNSDNCNFNSLPQEKIPIRLLNKDNKSAIEFYLNEETYSPKKTVNESFDIKKSIPEFANGPEEKGNKKEHKEKWFEKYTNLNADSSLVINQKESNMEKELFEKIKRKEDELNNKKREGASKESCVINSKHSCDIDRNMSQFAGLSKLIETTHLLRQAKAKKPKISQIELFHYDKKQWSKRLMAQLRLKEIEEELKKKKMKKEIQRLMEFGLDKEGISLEMKLHSIFEKKSSIPIDNDDQSNNQIRFKDKNEILRKIMQSSHELKKIAKICKDYSLIKKNEHLYKENKRTAMVKNEKRKRTISR